VGSGRFPWSFYRKPCGRYNLQKDPLTSLALRNLTFEEEALHFTKKHPEEKVEKSIKSKGASATQRR
jgi:hypothetical protein